ncbi:MAG TPA: LLM class flavin-dependent oxidoreductase [Vicinamibacterales bacterium]|nr:LLM class flavin-dependent oxidoreductase [Vicinamibacterales bacterium]
MSGKDIPATPGAGITGQPWPPKDDRKARLRECAGMMRALWAGETVTMRGHVMAQSARLYVRPEASPLLIGAAVSAETAGWVGEWADGMITVAGPRDTLREVVEAFRATGGGKPMFLQVPLSFAPSDEEALAAAMDQWRQAVVAPEKLADLSSPEAFDRETADAQPADVVSKVRVSSDIERHIAWLHEDAAMGFDRIYVHNVARDHQERFIGEFAEHVLPRFRPS